VIAALAHRAQHLQETEGRARQRLSDQRGRVVQQQPRTAASAAAIASETAELQLNCAASSRKRDAAAMLAATWQEASVVRAAYPLQLVPCHAAADARAHACHYYVTPFQAVRESKLNARFCSRAHVVRHVVVDGM
jgi:hypothetical protein